MPTSARKSSMGQNRRGPQKYIPYRADDLQHGKRTGLAVGMIEHDSDGFEPFEKLMGQADLRTPPKPKVQGKRRRLKAPIVVQEEEDYDDGEVSMDLVDSNPNSPATYFSQARVASITSSVQRVGSSSRPVQRLSDVDFDKVPSPRYSNGTPGVARRMSLGFGLSSGRPSHLAYSSRGDDFEEESEGGFDAPPFEEGFDDHELPASDIETDQERTPVPQRKHSLASTRKSFANLSRAEEDEQEQERDDEDMQIDEDQEEADEVERRVSGKQAKPKGRMRVVEEEPEPQHDDYMEDEIAQGMEEIDRMPEEDFDQEMEEDGGEEPQRGQVRQRDEDDSVEKGRTKKKARKENQAEPAPPKPKKSKPPKKQQNVLSEAMYDVNVDENGLRRSKRKRYAPLDWWRCEKVVYGRRESGNQFVPTIKEIRRIPKEEVQPLGAKHKRRRKPNSKGKASVEPEPPIFWNPEEGWDDETNPMAVVTDFVTGKESETRVAFTAGMVSLRDAANANFKFQKMFSDGSFLAAGQLLIPPEGSKPTKSTRDNSFIFYVIEGGVKVTIHRTSFIITTGGMFYVPRGNMYVIHNVSDRDARLFFAQARKVEKEELDGDREDRSPTFVNSPSR
ncbi:CENP-C like-domain-containing protein [Phanerochaete sordida]|uniref:CENP-C homolog n=1 Tax=Phanerochaete sordida TaxID=48140 RepID=A0A9P3G2Q0_9APHY|nr:CENP-C like-domain-containing protein [Phanerochaete sordida]